MWSIRMLGEDGGGGKLSKCSWVTGQVVRAIAKSGSSGWAAAAKAGGCMRRQMPAGAAAAWRRRRGWSREARDGGSRLKRDRDGRALTSVGVRLTFMSYIQRPV